MTVVLHHSCQNRFQVSRVDGRWARRYLLALQQDGTLTFGFAAAVGKLPIQCARRRGACSKRFQKSRGNRNYFVNINPK